MFYGLEQYKQGHFFFKKGDNLRTISESVPDLPGVYFVLSLAEEKAEIVYIGKSGTILQTGNFKGQTLRSRINNKQEKIKRQDFFTQRIENEQINALHIYWFVTIDENNNDLPGYVEGFLMQQYFKMYCRLPEWNKEY
ncbi:hypothetical protein [Flavobacterium lindanitolerans]|uniref:hypothetical protein n=1 Tax=Flavobacterium lindanitolerans TaxID=428988 RepID=UPI0027BB21B6|nr:hypothetical protein [Flavobacterium lindanitolerans]